MITIQISVDEDRLAAIVRSVMTVLSRPAEAPDKNGITGPDPAGTAEKPPENPPETPPPPVPHLPIDTSPGKAVSAALGSTFATMQSKAIEEFVKQDTRRIREATITPKATGTLPTPSHIAEHGAVPVFVGVPEGYVLLAEAAAAGKVDPVTLEKKLRQTGAQVAAVKGLGAGRHRKAAKDAEVAYALELIHLWKASRARNKPKRK